MSKVVRSLLGDPSKESKKQAEQARRERQVAQDRQLANEQVEEARGQSSRKRKRGRSLFIEEPSTLG